MKRTDAILLLLSLPILRTEVEIAKKMLIDNIILQLKELIEKKK